MVVIWRILNALRNRGFDVVNERSKGDPRGQRFLQCYLMVALS